MATLMDIMPRTPVITSSSKGPIVNLVGWIAMVTMCLAVITVLASKYIMLRKLSWNDFLLTFALLLAVGQTIATSDQVAAGLGQHLADVSGADYIKFQKAGYAGDLLYVAAVACAKVSTLGLLLGLTKLAGHRRPILAVGSVVAIWGVIALISSAFQCNMPHAWAYETGKCFNQIAFWETIGAFDILLDLAIIALPVLIVWNLQLSRAKKLAVVSAFSTRFLAIGMTIFRLVTLPHSLRKNASRVNAFATGSSDLTMTAYLPALATLLATFAAIFVTCVPHLRPFVESLQSGLLSGVILESGDNRTAYATGGSYAMNKVGAGSRIDPLATMRSERSANVVLKNANGQILVEKPPGFDQAAGNEEVVVSAERRGQRPRKNSTGSDGGRSRESHGSDAMIIKQTKEWSVRYEDR